MGSAEADGKRAFHKNVRQRIYPNKQQRELIERTFGCCRLAYNRSLALRREAGQAGGGVGYCATSRALTRLKHEPGYEFLQEVDSIALTQSLRDLEKAYANFFAGRAGYPRFKSKRGRQAYRTMNSSNGIRIDAGRIRLPKLGWVKIRQTMPLEGIRHVTVERTPSGKYFAIVDVVFEPAPLPPSSAAVGIDVGIKSFYTDSNGGVLENPKYLEAAMRRLAREQRRLARKQAGSANYEKQRKKVAKAHEKVANQRLDFLHKASTALIEENQTVCVEGLNVRNLLRNHCLAGSIASASWGRFFRMLEYKSQWYGRELVRVPRFYPSSQICSNCGHVNPAVKDLSVRRWTCPACGAEHDRDRNAAANILAEGLRLLEEG